MVLSGMRRVARRTAWAWDDILLDALETPLLIAIVSSGLVVFNRILPLQPEWDRAFEILFDFSIVLALVMFVDRATRGVLDRFAAGSTVMQGARGLIQAGVRGVTIGIGILIFLDSIGISITPILASLGVGSLAVALALQDTLANLFAGVYMIADKPIEPGHLVKLPTGEEGYVTKVGWRSTWIRLLPNNMLVIPNAKLAGGAIINYDLPQREIAFHVEVGVHYASDLGKSSAPRSTWRARSSAPSRGACRRPSRRCATPASGRPRSSSTSASGRTTCRPPISSGTSS